VLATGSHEPMAVAAAQAGRHVFIEKPIALSEVEGQAIIAAGKEGWGAPDGRLHETLRSAVERMGERAPRPASAPLRPLHDRGISPEVVCRPLPDRPWLPTSTPGRWRPGGGRRGRVTTAIQLDDPMLRYAYGTRCWTA